MEESILDSTKKILGLAAEYKAFDTDIITHINSTFSILQQLGIGPDEGFSIDSNEANWIDYLGEVKGLNMVKSYMFLKVGLLFDPPATSFAIQAKKEQIDEFEWRISEHREWMLDPVDPSTLMEVTVDES